MRFMKVLGMALSVAMVLALPAVVQAQLPGCKFNGCAAACPNGPCGVSVSIQQLGTICTGGGSFNLIGTQYQDTCDGDLLGPCGAGTDIIPPIRHWGLGGGFMYTKANSGCVDFDGADWLVNAKIDLGLGPANGHWFLLSGDWSAPKNDGCGLGATHTVSEITDVVPGGESTVNHSSFYTIIGCPVGGGGFDCDQVTGATGTCDPHDIPSAPVPSITIAGPPPRTLPCTGDPTPTDIGATNTNPLFFDVQVTLNTPNPLWYTEAGAKGAPALIRGYQIVYAKNTEPTTSNAAPDLKTGVWLPALDPGDPTKGAAAIPVGQSTGTISLPIGTVGTDKYWLATRLVYEDPANVTGPFDLAGNGLFLTSKVSAHCGPVRYMMVWVVYINVEAKRTTAGVDVHWETAEQDDTVMFAVRRTTAPEKRPESDPEVGTVMADLAPSGDYHFMDSSVAGDSHTTYYYYLQEYTSSGPGVVSDMVKVEGDTPTTGGRRGGVGTGARSRHRR